MRSEEGAWAWGAVLIALLSTATGVYAQGCEPRVATLVSTQGAVEIERLGQPRWQAVAQDDLLCPGDRIRVGPLGRAAVRLADEAETRIRLDERTLLTFPAPQAEKSFLLKLIEGVLHVLSRVPHTLTIETPLISAGVEGTEFVLGVSKREVELWVFEGRVRYWNAQGQLQVASGEGALARPGQAPVRRVRVKPREAVEWALYYPPLVDLRPESYPKALQSALSAYRINDLPAAFAALDRVPARDREGPYFLLRAGLLLGVGRVSQAEAELREAERTDPRSGGAFALRSVIALVRDQKDEALRLAEEGAGRDPGSPLAQAALSYAHQGLFEIEKALEHARRAVELRPEDALLWARISELELSRGDLDAALEAAEKAEALSPALPRTQAVLGYAYLTRIETDQARSAFERAIKGDPADPLPRLGMGLAKIRDGDLDEGTREIEIAASLDPNNALVRSYLGKAYYEQKRDGLASSEYEQAKLLDPRDPTPWFYDAIRKQTTNRPVEALHDLQKAIELNDNRAVYRSKLLLDQDLAARSAALGRTYRDLGFEQRALVEGWQSVNSDPSDFSGHRLLADTYSTRPRHEIARVSELLQSQLWQPLNVTPVQPQLAERDLLVLESAGPAAPAFNEFNPLFLRDQLSVQASGIVGGQETYGDEVVQAGIWKRLSYSLGQFHFETDGFRQNNDIKRDVFNAFLQASVSADTALQMEVRHSDTEQGDRRFRFLPDDFDRTLRTAVETDTVRFGFRHTFTPKSEGITSFTYKDTDGQLRGRTATGGLRARTLDETAYLFEAQHVLRSSHFNLTTGGGYYTTDGRRLDITLFETAFFDKEVHRGNVYGYLNARPWRDFSILLGVSGDFFEGTFANRDQVNPKFGLMWKPSEGTIFRGTIFKALETGLSIPETIEPTQVAGFTQYFGPSIDSDFVNANFSGISTLRYGAGLDQRLGANLFGGLEFSKRDLEVPGLVFEEPGEEDWEEYLGQTYLYWTPTSWLAAGVEYQFERFERGNTFGAGTGIVEANTHRVPIRVSMFHHSGFSGRIGGTYIDQAGEFVPRGFDPRGVPQSGENRFWVLDAELQYRLPNRLGFVTLGIENFLDEEFQFQETDPGVQTTQQGRLIFGRLTFAF